MGYAKSSKAAQNEVQILDAIQALKNSTFSNPYAAAIHFEVSYDTLRRRMAGGLSHSQAAAAQQILSIAEEKTLIRWITRYTTAGTPISPSLLIELAELLRARRVRRDSGSEAIAKTTTPIGHEWIYRFLGRYPTIQGIYARQLDNARFSGATFDVIKAWFNAVAALFNEHSYELQDVWNVDESGFGVGESQTTRVLVPTKYNQKKKVIAGKQEWITDIECINAAGRALPPLLIFKGQNLNSGWIPPETPADWHFGVSENGWTSNTLGLHWLVHIFEPLTRREGVPRRRLLIADGHGSHIRAEFIAHCMENDIDLLIMPPHCSHLLQPLDVGVFSAFKRAHANETDRVSRLSAQRIPRQEWVQMFARARKKAVIMDNILSGWRGAGLFPSDPDKVLKQLPEPGLQVALKPRTPTGQGDLDFSLLKSSPPDGTELRESNVLLNAVLAEVPGLPSQAKRYVDRVTRMAETQNAELAILRKQLEEKDEVLQSRKKRTRGKRVRLEGEYVYSTPRVLQVAREAEAKPVAKRPRGRPRKQVVEQSEDSDEPVVLDDQSDTSDEELVDVVAGRTRSKRPRLD